MAPTGFGNFTGNVTSDGLYVRTHGSVTLSHVIAHFNGNGAGDNGIEILADGNATVVCSTTYGNLGDGLYVRSSNDLGSVNILTLNGFFAFRNGGLDENPSYVTLVRGSCP